MKKTVSLPFMVLSILFCVCLIISNILEVKMISLGPVTATAGLIVFPISYIINDCIAEVWGYKKARLIICHELSRRSAYTAGNTLASGFILERTRSLFFSICRNSSYRCSQFDRIFGRIVFKCLRHEQNESSQQR